ncbi:MAG: hypothetical protein QOK40_2079, partial [Miltoncostaeaceae bacterium]|nr:hypothetical protein [Miltoncostaeaceae bacterium]
HRNEGERSHRGAGAKEDAAIGQ